MALTSINKIDMKKKIYITVSFAVLAALVMTSCQKEENAGLDIRVMEFTAAGQQKAYMDTTRNANLLQWTNNESIIISGKTKNIHVSANRTWLQDLDDITASNYYAVYPTTGSTLTNSTGGSALIPASQAYTLNNGKQVINAPLAACLPGKEGTLCFTNVGALLRVVVQNCNTQTLTVNSITVTAATANLHGTQAFSFVSNSTSNGALTLGALTAGSDPHTVTLTGCSAAGTLAARGGVRAFNILLAPYATADKLTLTVNATVNGGTAKDYVLVQNTARNLARGEVAIQFFSSDFGK